MADKALSPPLTRVLERLDAVRPTASGHIARCPAHEDDTPSLSISETVDGRALLHCFAGCETSDILTAIGLTMCDLFPDNAETVKPRAVRTRVFDITDASGAIVAQHVRTDLSNGHKDFVWRRNGRPGLHGLRVSELPLYGMPAVTMAAPGSTVLVAEGEVATDALTANGIVAFGTATGADTIPSDTVLAQLRGLDVVVWPDHDDAGRRHMARIATRLAALGIASRVITWNEAPVSGDAVDFFDNGGTVTALHAMIAAASKPDPDYSAGHSDSSAAERTLRFQTAAEIAAQTPAEVTWAAKPWLAFGATTELSGKIKASGKTTMASHMVRCILDGLPFLAQPTTKCAVIWLTEQPPASFRETLRRADLLHREDLAVLYAHDAMGVPWPKVAAAALAEAERRGARVIVVDTLGRFAGLRGDAENNAGDAESAVLALTMEAAAKGIAVLLIRHERKSGGDVGDAARGSTAFGGAVDIVLLLRRMENAPRNTIRVLRALSRFDETPDEMAIDLTDNGYVVLGDTESLAREDGRRRLLSALPCTREQACAMQDWTEKLGEAEIAHVGLCSRTGLKKTLIGTVLDELANEGLVSHVGAGKRGDPRRYYRTTDSSAAHEDLGSAETMPETRGAEHAGNGEWRRA